MLKIFLVLIVSLNSGCLVTTGYGYDRYHRPVERYAHDYYRKPQGYTHDYYHRQRPRYYYEYREYRPHPRHHHH